MKLLSSAEGFSIEYKASIVFNHSRKNPGIRAGWTSLEFSMFHGNFRPKKSSINYIKLFDWTVGDNSVERIDILFSDKLRLSFKSEKSRLVIHFLGVDPDISYISFNIPGRKNEHIYGCGEQYSRLNLKGKRFPVWIQEQGVRYWRLYNLAVGQALSRTHETLD